MNLLSEAYVTALTNTSVMLAGLWLGQLASWRSERSRKRAAGENAHPTPPWRGWLAALLANAVVTWYYVSWRDSPGSNPSQLIFILNVISGVMLFAALCAFAGGVWWCTRRRTPVARRFLDLAAFAVGGNAFCLVLVNVALPVGIPGASFDSESVTKILIGAFLLTTLCGSIWISLRKPGVEQSDRVN